MSGEAETRQVTEAERDRLLQHMQRLTAVGIAISAERNVQKIFDMIVKEAMDLTNADGATLYLVTPDEQGLQFEIVLNRTLGTDLRSSNQNLKWPTVPLTKDGKPNRANVSAYAAIIKEPINIPDVYNVAEFDFSGTRRYDAEHGYRCCSMLVVPLQDHEGTVTGVLQLINAQPLGGGAPIPFTETQKDVVRSLASQAAVSLNNVRLIESLDQLFDSLIATVASTIDAKSPWTGGHVRRVTELSVEIARAISDARTGRFAATSFNEAEMKEIRTAGWLHDFGKVATPDGLVDKRTKLETAIDRVETVGLRFDVARLQAQLEAAVTALRQGNAEQAETIAKGDLPDCRAIAADKEFALYWNDGAHGPTDADVARLQQIARDRGTITPDELENLSIRRGTLTTPERRKIEQHVSITRQSLQQLRFPRALANVPIYAGGHHEMLDGSGYPLKLKGDEIALQTRILAVADIFEALTASRPYKKAMPLEKALGILGAMAKEGKLDADVIQAAIDGGVFARYAEKELKPVAQPIGSPASAVAGETLGRQT